jgi:hypothetical protein
MPGVSKLPQLFDRAIGALLTHAKINDAAKAIGVSHQTLRHWLTQPEFVEALEQRRKEALDETVNALRLVSQDAVKALSRNLRCGIPQAEISAAAKVLELCGLGAGAHGVAGSQAALVRVEVAYISQQTNGNVIEAKVIDADAEND